MGQVTEYRRERAPLVLNRDKGVACIVCAMAHTTTPIHRHRRIAAVCIAQQICIGDGRVVCVIDSVCALVCMQGHVKVLSVCSCA